MTRCVISCCSTVDVPRDLLDRRDIRYVYFNYELDGKPLKDDFGQSTPPAELYARMLAGADAKTSQVSIGEYMQLWKPLLEEGADIVHATLSSGISGTFCSASAAAAELAKSYPERTIRVVDSLCASSGYGLLVDKLADLRDEGLDANAIADWAEEHKLEERTWFFTTDLSFFVRGGRVSRVAGMAAGMLSICPLLEVDVSGELKIREKVRTKRKVLERIVEKMREECVGGGDYAGKVYVTHSECLEDAQALADLVSKAFPNIDGEVLICEIGATIGCHTGPGTVVLSFWGERRV